MGVGLLVLAAPSSQVIFRVLCIFAGVGLGMALGGILIETWYSPASFAAAAAASLLAAAGALWLSRR